LQQPPFPFFHKKQSGEADLRAEPLASGAAEFLLLWHLKRFGAKQHKKAPAEPPASGATQPFSSSTNSSGLERSDTNKVQRLQ